MEQGLIELYFGTGKGKTCCAVGLCLRAAGNDFTCAIVQFMKAAGMSGECAILEQLPQILLYSYGREGFLLDRQAAAEEDVQLAQDALKKAYQLMPEVDILVLDELTNAWYFNLLTEQEIKDFLAQKSEQTELVITGRIAPDFLLEAADLVTEFKEIKHPYSRGIQRRKGIEY
ncbi:MAG: cob(I)yrinic acid a,c-diamide adenosyltransferase [Bacillota bacterium]